MLCWSNWFTCFCVFIWFGVLFPFFLFWAWCPGDNACSVLGVSRRYVYWGTKWISWISCRNALWPYSCPVHFDEQGNGCYGNIIIYIFSVGHLSLCLIISFNSLSWSLLQLEKYKNYDFGRCPRVYCCGQPCLPVGQSDIPRSSTVKIYCPKCDDIYYPRSKYQGSILTLHCYFFT